MNTKKIFVFLISYLIFFGLSTTVVAADPSINVTLPNPFNCGRVSPCSIFTLLKSIIDNILLPIGGVLAVLAFVYSGFLYVMAQGNETQLKTAHKALLYTSIGTAVLLGSWVIAQVIETTINQLKS